MKYRIQGEVELSLVPENPRPQVTGKAHWLLSASAWNTAQKGPEWLKTLSDEALSHFSLLSERWYWSHLEGNPGQYNLDGIEAELEAAASRGLNYAPNLMWDKFESHVHSTPFRETDSVVPEDLEPFQWTHEAHNDPTRKVFRSALYEPVVRARYQALCEAVYQRFSPHPNFAGIQTSETAGMAKGPGVSLEKLVRELRLLFGALSDMARRYDRWSMPGWNFLAGIPGDKVSHDLRVQAWNEVFSLADPENTVPWTPDLMIGNTGLDIQVYPLFTDPECIIRKFRKGSSAQHDSYRLARNGGVDLQTLMDTLVPQLDLDVIAWTWHPGWWDLSFEDAMEVIRAGWPGE